MSHDVVDKFSRQYTLLSRDDWIYAGFLGGSFLLALGQRFLFRGDALYGVLRQSPGAIGFSVALFVLGRAMPLLVFVVVFAYLLLTRHLHELLPGLPELASQANALQLIITLRAIGLAYDVADARYNKKNPGALKPRRYLEMLDPDFYTIFTYLYHYCGLFTGPYFSFQMFLDSSDAEAAAFHEAYLDGQIVEEYKWRGKRILWAVPLFILTNKLFPLDGLRSDDVFEWTLLYRLLYAAAVFTVFRMRVYAAWALSECICVTLNVGIYPAAAKSRIVVGPTDLDAFHATWHDGAAPADSLAVQNIDVPAVEASDGYRSGMRGWNRSVQSWLALYVHSRSPPAIRMPLTMFVSALWHGTYAGYFMSFMVVPLCTAAEDLVFKLFPADEQTGRRNPLLHYIYVYGVRQRGFDFMATGFLLKNLADTHRFWSALGYWLPIYMTVVIVVASVALHFQKQQKKKQPAPAEDKEKLLAQEN